MAVSLGRLDLASVLLNVSINIPRFWPLSNSFPHEFPRFGTLASRVRPMKCSGSVEGNLGIEKHLQVCPQLPLVRHTIPGLNHTAREYRILLPALLVFPVCDPLVPSRYGLSLFKINDAGVADVRGRHAHPWSCAPPPPSAVAHWHYNTLLAPSSLSKAVIRSFSQDVDQFKRKSLVKILSPPVETLSALDLGF